MHTALACASTQPWLCGKGTCMNLYRASATVDALSTACDAHSRCQLPIQQGSNPASGKRPLVHWRYAAMVQARVSPQHSTKSACWDGSGGTQSCRHEAPRQKLQPERAWQHLKKYSMRLLLSRPSGWVALVAGHSNTALSRHMQLPMPYTTNPCATALQCKLQTTTTVQPTLPQ